MSSLNNDIFEERRQKMVTQQIKKRGVTDAAVLQAMSKLPRHLFVPERFVDDAYDDGPLSIGAGQTISQPYVVASMTSHLRLNNQSRVLEIGTGSGYHTAIASAANIGGAASAPIVAAFHKPALVPVSILMALLGYAIGNPAAYIAAILCSLV